MQHAQRVDAPLPTGGYIGITTPVEDDFIPSADNMGEAECLAERRQLMLEKAKAENALIASKNVGDKEAVAGLGHRLQGYAARLGMLKRRLQVIRSDSSVQAFFDATRELVDEATLLRIYARQQELLAARDSNRLPQGEDSRSEAECEASQSGDAEGGASPTLKSTPTRTAK